MPNCMDGHVAPQVRGTNKALFLSSHFMYLYRTIPSQALVLLFNSIWTNCFWHYSKHNQMAGQQWVCMTTNIDKVAILCECTAVLNILLHPHKKSYEFNDLIQNYKVFCVCVCVRTGWIMEGGPPSCNPPPSVAWHIVEPRGCDPAPPLCEIAGGNEEGRVNIRVTLMDARPESGVLCFWLSSCMDEGINESI